MIRLYEYNPRERVDDDGNIITVEAYRDFQNYLFSQPYGFIWDFPNDKVTIHSIAYRISSLRHINDGASVTCICLCGGGGGGANTGGGTAGIRVVKTDNTLHGEGHDELPLGLKLSELEGNRLQIFEDGVYVGKDCNCLPPEIIEGCGDIYVGGFENRTPTLNEIKNLSLVGATNPVRINIRRDDIVEYKTPLNIMRSYIVIPAELQGIQRMFDVDNEQSLKDLLVKEPATVMIDEIEYEMYYLQYLKPATGEKILNITL